MNLADIQGWIEPQILCNLTNDYIDMVQKGVTTFELQTNTQTLMVDSPQVIYDELAVQSYKGCLKLNPQLSWQDFKKYCEIQDTEFQRNKPEQLKPIKILRRCLNYEDTVMASTTYYCSPARIVIKALEQIALKRINRVFLALKPSKP